MSMTEVIGLWPIIVQTAIIVVAIAASYGRIKERIVVLETTATHQQNTVDRLVDKVDDMGRYLVEADE